MIEALVGLGSNLGDRRRHLETAVDGLRSLGRVVAVSGVYETAPVGGPQQPDYLNLVAAVATDLEARPLLDGLLDLERAAGRERRERWGPRVLDLDLLLFGDEEIDEPGLRVPHPHLPERRFVLEPLLEIRPDATLPNGPPLATFLEGVSDQDVRRVGPAVRPTRWWRRLFPS